MSQWIKVEKKTYSSNLDCKISEPCWFYNNGGCKKTDGTPKSESECKYLHIYCPNVKRPLHLNSIRPCDKYNLDGKCDWGTLCKYSHRKLTEYEWNIYYPSVPFNSKVECEKKNNYVACLKPCDKYNLDGKCQHGEYCKYSHRELNESEWESCYPTIPFNVKLDNIYKLQTENKIKDLENIVRILEFKIKCINEYCEQQFKTINDNLNI